MKYLFAFLVVSFCWACSAPKVEVSNSSIFIEKQLADFIAVHPDWKKDEETEKKTTEKFRHKVINWSNEESFLSDLPFKFKKLVDSNVNGTAVKLAYFETYSDSSRVENSLLNVMQLQIKGLVSTAQVKDLEVDKAYYIKGHMYKQGKRNDIQYIELGQFKGYALGSYMFTIAEVKPITETAGIN